MVFREDKSSTLTEDFELPESLPEKIVAHVFP
jgi:hypothetical protein